MKGRGAGGQGDRAKARLAARLPVRPPVIGIIGPGRAGLGLALALRRAGVTVLGVHGRRRKAVPRGVRLSLGAAPPWLPRADVILLAVRDDALAGAVRQLVEAGTAPRRRVVLHLSGARTAGVLAPLRPTGAAVGSMHPLMTVSADPLQAAGHFRGATFALEGDATAVRVARSLVRALGGVPVVIAPEAKVLYHAGAVFASNYVVAMLGAAEALLMAAGFTARGARSALAPLTRASVGNVAAEGPVRALTGPVARGDAATVRGHLAALPRPLRAVYAEAGRVALMLAELGGLPARRAAAVRRALRGG